MRVVIADVPAKFNTPVAPLVNPPVPDKAAEAVIVPLLVKTAGLVTVSNVATVNVPLLVVPPVVKVALGISMAVVPLKLFPVPLKV